MTKKEAYAKLDAILEITNTPYDADDEELHLVDGISATWAEHDKRLNEEAEHEKDAILDHPRWGDACEHRDRVLLCEICTPPEEEYLAAARGLDGTKEDCFKFFGYHMVEMSRADFDVLWSKPEEMSDLVHEIQAFEHHECCEECPVECPAARPLGRGEYKAYLKWCDDLEAKAALAEEEEWYRFKADCSAEDYEEYEAMKAADPLGLSGGILIRRPAPTDDELRAMIQHNAEAKAEAEAIELAQKNWDASQKTAKAICPASLRSGSIARRVLPEPQTELLPYPLVQPDVPVD
jgi:hypothetical protein